jgi:YHS domain-containing protein
MTAKQVLDPVCGMAVDPESAPARMTHADERYHFCATACRDRFARDPARYLGEGAEPVAMADVLEGATSVEPDNGTTAARPCPECGTPTLRPVSEEEIVGRLTMAEYATIVRQQWRRRLGRRAYAREHSARLIRALALHALKPESPVAAISVEEELSLEVARLRADGLNRAQVQREFYHLSRAAAQVLMGAGLSTHQTAAMIETIDAKLVGLLEWQRSKTVAVADAAASA